MCHTIPGGHQAGALGGRGSRAHVCLSPCGALWPRQARQGCCPPGHSRTARPGCGGSGREGRARTREAPSLPVRRGREAGGARGLSDASGVEEDACHTLPPTPSRKRSASCGQETPRHKLRTHVARGAGETRLQRKEGPLLGCPPGMGKEVPFPLKCHGPGLLARGHLTVTCLHFDAYQSQRGPAA